MTLRYVKPPSQRQLRVAEIIRAEISGLFLRGILVNYGLEHVIVSISQVRISPDLKIATAFLVAPVAGEKALLLPILDSLANEVRRLTMPKLGLRFVPQLRIVMDDATNYADQIENILSSIKS
jgi:ribosome-binding factor A